MSALDEGRNQKQLTLKPRRLKMTKNNLMVKNNLPSVVGSHFDRDEFITPFDKLIDKFFNQSFPHLSKELGMDVFQTSAYPKCDIVDFSDRIEIVAEVPGLTKDQITIDIDSDVISIKGDKVVTTEREGGTYLRRELKKSSFKRTFSADPSIFNLDDISARFSDGILELTIPKLNQTKTSKRIVEIE
jgi:HSP20 family protein